MGNILMKVKRKKKASFSTLNEDSLSTLNANCSSTELIDLNADCLFHIFSYLDFPDLLKLRTQCSTLNYVVCKYLPRLTILSVVLTESKNKNPESSFKAIEKRDSVIIRKEKAFRKFIKFIKKYEIRNVESLSVLMNDYSYINDIPELLELCPKVRILFLDRIRDSWPLEPNLSLKIGDFEHFLVSITSLSSLHKLRFFPRHQLNPYELKLSSIDQTTARTKLNIFRSEMRERFGESYIDWYSIEKIREEEIEANFVIASKMIHNLQRNMAVDMSEEMKQQNEYSSRIASICGSWDSETRLKRANERAHRLLK